MVKKTSKKEQTKKFYLTILYHIRDYNRLPVEGEIGISKQNMNYYVKKLKIDEVIYSPSYSVWHLNEDKLKVFLGNNIQSRSKKTDEHTNPLKAHLPSKLTTRGHGYAFGLKIKSFMGWNVIRGKLKGKWIKNDTVKRIMVKGRKVWLCKDSIVVYFKKGESMWGDSGASSKKHAIHEFIVTVKKIEKQIGHSFKINKEYLFKITKSEYANINNVLAKDYNDKNKKLKIYNKRGELWALCDKSFNRDEFETVHSKTSEQDYDNVVMKFFNSLKTHYEETGESFTIDKLMSGLNQTLDSHRVAVENIKDTTKQVNIITKLLQVKDKPMVNDLQDNSDIRNYTG